MTARQLKMELSQLTKPRAICSTEHNHAYRNPSAYSFIEP